MKKYIQLLAMVILITSCKSAVTAPKDVVRTEPTFAYKQQIENLEQGIYLERMVMNPIGV